MSREDPQMKVRLPAELKEKLEVAAKENKRSMNAEVVHRLKESFETLIHITYKDSDSTLSDNYLWKSFIEHSKHDDENTRVFINLFEQKFLLDKENERLYKLLLEHLSHQNKKED
ncbi:DNA-binding protein [Salmonella enterica subsp. salamae]|uniref:Arc family DNA-binding protein n=1 Tax=Salmonella enterica TaxID=28901 RepID=A0A743EL78_SALER|nr:Arc family DNA-binding protein [Salmonella enterica]EAB5934897.1 Arc family DNA-binding protein [Salmonella enterica subsp. enterica serovar Eastbourne]EBO3251364.1 Arc family DNA-binding protein [Salmonella enterica subsp. enterica serovar Tennessee]EBQ6140122.1 DNA-binding protein [Salmonella enterica subsp. enterica serovar Corvallis]EBS3140901.1 Arc family DNA-binding protein [Salmonella enterica subsp. enterica serovar Braenderup]EBS4305624.1 DNA-binding protein [Salmonella enterica su